jgi:ribosomal protein L40E
MICSRCGAKKDGEGEAVALPVRVTRIKHAGIRVQRTYVCQTCGATWVVDAPAATPAARASVGLN